MSKCLILVLEKKEFCFFTSRHVRSNLFLFLKQTFKWQFVISTGLAGLKGQFCLKCPNILPSDAYQSRNFFTRFCFTVLAFCTYLYHYHRLLKAAFYVKQPFLETLNNSEIVCFQTNFPKGMNCGEVHLWHILGIKYFLTF